MQAYCKSVVQYSSKVMSHLLALFFELRGALDRMKSLVLLKLTQYYIRAFVSRCFNTRVSFVTQAGYIKAE